MAQTSPVGRWATIDDVTSRQKSIVDIYSVGDTVEGKIIKTFYYTGEVRKTVCDKCQGDDYMKPIIGMVILRGMKAEGDGRWSDGTIMDPHVGKTYKCIMIVSDDGKTMKVHGYIGLPLLGRTQIWHRLSGR
jgi:uncharacterized protein (DUF2147 family)